MDADVPRKRCAKCGEEKPATLEYFYASKNKSGLTSYCRPCVSKATKEWIAAHPDKKREIDRNGFRSRRNANPEKDRLRCADYYAAHRDEQKERRAVYRAANRDKVKALEHRRKAKARAFPATFTTADWLRCLEYWGDRCAVCGRPQGLWHTLAQDHWIALTRGGAYTPDNIVPLCHGDGGCNNSKSNRDAHEWLVLSFGARRAARIEKRVREYFAWVVAQSGASAA